MGLVLHNHIDRMLEERIVDVAFGLNVHVVV